jgi:hypothetical protein
MQVMVVQVYNTHVLAVVGIYTPASLKGKMLTMKF